MMLKQLSVNSNCVLHLLLATGGTESSNWGRTEG